MLAIAIFADHQNHILFEQTQRTTVHDQAALIRARLEGKIASNIQLVHGLVSTISTEPDMGQERFGRLAAHILMQENELRHVAAAPDLVVRLIHPLSGNQDALGLDYRVNAEQRAAAIAARDSGSMMLAGPVHLVQGGRGFIGRFPVFSDDEAGERRFWGIVSAIIEADRLYAASGLTDPELGIEVAIGGRDGIGPGDDIFFGDPAILAQDPISMEIVLPNGRWQMAAIPEGGWQTTPPNTWALRLTMALAAALVLAPLALAARLNSERMRRLDDQKRREADLKRLSRRLALAVETSRVGVWEMDIETGDLSWDDRMNELYGLPRDGGPRTYRDWRRALHPEDRQKTERKFNTAVRNRGQYHSEFRVLAPDGHVRHIRAIGSVYQDPGGPSRILGVNWDVTADTELSGALLKAKTQAEAKNFELESAKARIEHNALHDPLTGLPNRRYLDEVLSLQEGRARGADAHSALLHMDLDRFKHINDTLGHAAGDAMLVHTAEILKAAVRQDDFVARIGGDEFVVFCMNEMSQADLRCLADRIISLISQPVSYKTHECRFGVSIGIAECAEARVSPRQMLINADIALYRAKRQGRNRFEFFTEALQAEIITSKRLADDILKGLENDEFTAHYQPQFDAHSLEVVGIEALARWNHPIEGLLSPAAFMDTAEELNVVAALDHIVLKQALAQRRAWQAKGLHVRRMSVNVSARRLHDETLIDTLKGMDITPGTLSFELVESIYLDESDPIVTWNIDQIRELGIDIEIDDFGTGYASIVSLLQLRPTRMKIDRQLVMPIADSRPRLSLVRSIIEIGNSLGIESIAEGVETPEHIELLRACGCATLQGFVFAKPMPGDEIAQLLREKQKAGSACHQNMS
ncbi:bifunctional diguanylate cyclase/phosphodiesterase [Pelagibacterium montanilacus]|uniref:bifunctional diguanylate cyclase/phosphodiesterase n=1 Tax=Pelagibacterium montanilacus TaxID=2185280 RepID=UPI000F8E5465|nr:EAL domain-containing protein [Pelagibacterium montanilacus]